jgi:hypothetical protein
VNVQTPVGLQNAELLLNLDYDEIILLKSINYFFENEHRFYGGQKEDLLFDLVNQILDKTATGEFNLDVNKYYTGNLENEMDHANLTQMRHLLRDAGALLYKRMYTPGLVKRERRGEMIDACVEEELAHVLQ